MSEYYNKVIFGGVVKLDLSSDDVSPQDVASARNFMMVLVLRRLERALKIQTQVLILLQLQRY